MTIQFRHVFGWIAALGLTACEAEISYVPTNPQGGMGGVGGMSNTGGSSTGGEGGQTSSSASSTSSTSSGSTSSSTSTSSSSSSSSSGNASSSSSSSGGLSCATDADCPKSNSECAQARCIGNVCVTIPEPMTTACNGTCHCSGVGTCAGPGCITDAICPQIMDPCFVSKCLGCEECYILPKCPQGQTCTNGVCSP